MAPSSAYLLIDPFRSVKGQHTIAFGHEAGEELGDGMLLSTRPMGWWVWCHVRDLGPWMV